MCLHLSTNERQLIICLDPLTNGRQLPSFRSLKNYHVLAFWLILPQYQSWLPICFSADVYMANREWDFLIPMSACTKRVEEKRPSHFHYSACNKRVLILAWHNSRPTSPTSIPYKPENVWGCHISLPQNIYNYVYIVYWTVRKLYSITICSHDFAFIK